MNTKKDMIMIPTAIITRIKKDPVRAYLVLRMLGTLTAKMITKKEVPSENIDELIVQLLNGMEEQVVNIKKLDLKEEDIN